MRPWGERRRNGWISSCGGTRSRSSTDLTRFCLWPNKESVISASFCRGPFGNARQRASKSSARALSEVRREAADAQIREKALTAKRHIDARFSYEGDETCCFERSGARRESDHDGEARAPSARGSSTFGLLVSSDRCCADRTSFSPRTSSRTLCRPPAAKPREAVFVCGQLVSGCVPGEAGTCS